MYSKEYVGTLALNMANCQEISSVIHNTKFSEKGLIKIFAQYSECTGDRYHVFGESEINFRLSPYFIGGMNFGTNEIACYNNLLSGIYSNSGSLDFEIGSTINIKNIPNWMLVKVSFGFNSETHTLKKQMEQAPSKYIIDHRVSFNNLLLGLGVGPKINFKKGYIYVNFNIKLESSIPKKSVLHKITTNIYTGVSSETTDELPLTIESLLNNPHFFDLGFSYKLVNNLGLFGKFTYNYNSKYGSFDSSSFFSKMKIIPLN